MQTIGRSARMARHHKRHSEARINLVSMIDMMTILVFFLLVHGGFVRLAVLELNLPTAQSEATNEEPEFQLEVTVRENGIEVGDRATGLLNRIDKTGDDYHLDQLSAYLLQVKGGATGSPSTHAIRPFMLLPFLPIVSGYRPQ